MHTPIKYNVEKRLYGIASIVDEQTRWNYWSKTLWIDVIIDVYFPIIWAYFRITYIIYNCALIKGRYPEHTCSHVSE